MMKLWMSLFALALSASVSFGKPLWCAKNEGDQGVKRICLLENAKGKVRGFLLFNANGTKSYLATVRESFSAFGEQGGGEKKWTYTVKISDEKLVPKGEGHSTIWITTRWFYSEGSTQLTGQTPGGRKLAAVLEEGDH